MEPKDSLEKSFRLEPLQKKALQKLGIENIRNLLYHFPIRYGNISEIKKIADLKQGDEATIYGRIISTKTSYAYRKKIPIGEAVIEDDTGRIRATWFHQAYMAKILTPNSLVKLSGKAVLSKKGDLYFANPESKKMKELPIDAGHSLFGGNSETVLYAVYQESRGITSRWFNHAVRKIMAGGLLDKIDDPIPPEILQKYSLPKLKTALIWIHAPEKESDAQAARKRFAFEEIFMIQLNRQKIRLEFEKKKSFEINAEKNGLEDFIGRFSFGPTGAQDRAVSDILSDFKRGRPMGRLLEGDVGSGKTFVAAVTAYAVVTSRPNGQNFGNLQVAYMAPTEILAKQHFQSFIEYYEHLPIQIALITGRGAKKFPSKVSPDKATDISRAQLMKWVSNGEISILIGTHALIQKSVKFKNLAYVIIDEQHRFGVIQRKTLARGKTRSERGTNARGKTAGLTDPLLYRDLTYRIREAVFKVKKELGLGHKEVVYQRALEEAFASAKLIFNREKQMPIFYQKKKVGVYQPDFIIDDKIIIELKALPFLGTEPKKQLWNYLTGSPYKLGLLINFGHQQLDIARIVYDKARLDTSASSLQQSASVPHLLSMTATPIPRTLALTIYGDLDLTLLDEMPAGRKSVITETVLPDEREKVYEKIRQEIKSGRQVYVICPRINPVGTNDLNRPTSNGASEPLSSQKLTALNIKSVKAEAARLKKSVFPEEEIAILHSKMKPAEKEKVMARFSSGEINILVSTSIVEVGVNVPNATIIIIEGAERFGLAQLHQLRGRVLRSNHQAYCYLFSEVKTAQALKRLQALKQAKNGFELSELDLSLRGAGELGGGKQWGISDLGMEAIRNIKMVEAARAEAKELLSNDPELSGYPLLRDRVLSEKVDIHFE